MALFSLVSGEGLFLFCSLISWMLLTRILKSSDEFCVGSSRASPVVVVVVVVVGEVGETLLDMSGRRPRLSM